MPRRQIDTSRAVCDTCGKLYQQGDAVYSIADRWDEDNDDVLVSFRHWDCHVPFEETMRNLKDKIGEAQEVLRKIRT